MPAWQSPGPTLLLQCWGSRAAPEQSLPVFALGTGALRPSKADGVVEGVLSPLRVTPWGTRSFWSGLRLFRPQALGCVREASCGGFLC